MSRVYSYRLREPLFKWHRENTLLQAVDRLEKTFYFPEKFTMMYEGEEREFIYLGHGSFNVAYQFAMNGKLFVYKIIINDDGLQSYPAKADTPERSARLLNEFNQPLTKEEEAKPYRVTDKAGKILCRGIVMPFFVGVPQITKNSMIKLFLYFIKERRIFVDGFVRGNLIHTVAGMGTNAIAGIKTPDASFLIRLMKTNEETTEKLMESSQTSIDFWSHMNEAYYKFFADELIKGGIDLPLIELGCALLLIEQLDLYQSFATAVFFDEEESLFYLPNNVKLMQFLCYSYMTLESRGTIDCSTCDESWMPAEIKNKIETYNCYAEYLEGTLSLPPKEVKQILRQNNFSEIKFKALQYFISTRKHSVETALDLITQFDEDGLQGSLIKI